MKLGHVAKNAKMDRPARQWSTGRLFITALVCLMTGFGGLIWRTGNPIVIGDAATLQVIETTAGFSWFGQKWRTVPNGEWAIAFPIISHVHRMNRPADTVSVRLKAQTHSGLDVQIRSLTIRYEVPHLGAVDVIRHVGPQQSQLEAFVRTTGIVVLRALLAETPDATSGVPIDPDDLENRLTRRISDVLAEVGVKVQAVHLGGLRYDAQTDELIGRLRAARSRSTKARKDQVNEELGHKRRLEEIKRVGRALIEDTASEFDPLIQGIRNSGSRRMVDADLEFERRRRHVSIQQKMLRVRSEAWAYRARKHAEALGLRVKASAHLNEDFFVDEIGRSIYGQLEQMDTEAQCVPAARTMSTSAGGTR